MTGVFFQQAVPVALMAWLAWPRLDVLVASWLLLQFALAVLLEAFSATITEPEGREARGVGWDAVTERVAECLFLFRFAAVAEYGRVQTFTAPDSARLAGVVIAASTLPVWVWIEATLLDAIRSGALATRGPYALVRHPRYLALIVWQVSLALVFVSVTAWVLVLAWTVLLARRIGLEEGYLERRFGAEFLSYQRRTRRLVPLLW